MCCFALSQPLHVTPSSSPLAPLFPSSTPIVRVASCVSIALKALCIKMDALELNTSGRLRTTQLWVNHMPYIMPYGHIIMSHMGLVCAVHSFCFFTQPTSAFEVRFLFPTAPTQWLGELGRESGRAGCRTCEHGGGGKEHVCEDDTLPKKRSSWK